MRISDWSSDVCSSDLFTQIDCETSFLNEVEIREIFEGMIRQVFQEVLEITLPQPFPVMGWAEAMRRFGSDKPDLRVKLEFTDVGDQIGRASCRERVCQYV